MRPAATLLPAVISVVALNACNNYSAPSAAAPTPTHHKGTTMPASTGTLATQLDAFKADFSARADEETKAAFEQGIKEVADSGVLDSALKVGDRAPDFELPDARGSLVRSADLLAQGPIVVTWYRGGWCPYCNLQLRAYQEVLPELKSAGAQLVAISPETADNSLTTLQKNELDFVVLSDVGLGVAEAFGVAYRLPEVVEAKFKGRLDLPASNGDDSWRLPLSATYVIDRDGVVRWAYVTEDYRERAEPSDVVEAVRAVR